MDTFESALESPDVILFDENIFTGIKYSLIDPHENMIYVDICQIDKKTQNLRKRSKYCEIASMFFFGAEL